MIFTEDSERGNLEVVVNYEKLGQALKTLEDALNRMPHGTREEALALLIAKNKIESVYIQLEHAGLEKAWDKNKIKLQRLMSQKKKLSGQKNTDG